MSGPIADAHTELARMRDALFDLIDGCDRALVGVADSNDPVVKGMLMLREQALASARTVGLESVMPLGEMFDPALHEALSTVPGGTSGQVAHVHTRGWLRGGVLLRPARVIVHDGVGCPHGRPGPDQCLRCFREQRRQDPSASERARRSQL